MGDVMDTRTKANRDPKTPYVVDHGYGPMIITDDGNYPIPSRTLEFLLTDAGFETIKQMRKINGPRAVPG